MASLRRASVAASLLLVAVLLSCGGHETASPGGIDLTTGLAAADVITETTSISPASPTELRHFLPKWDFRYSQGSDIAVGLGLASDLWWFSARSQAVEVTLHGESRPWVESIRVAVNGQVVGELAAVNGPHVYRVDVPAGVVEAGRNSLTLHYVSGDPTKPYSSDHPAALWYLFEIASQQPTVEPAPRVTQDGLFVPFGTRLEYFLEIANGASLELGGVDFVGGQGLLRVELERDLRGIERLAQIETEGVVNPIPLQAAESADRGPEIVCLALEVTSETAVSDLRAGVIISQPMIVPGEVPTVSDAPPKESVAAVSGSPVSSPDANILLYVIDTLRADHLGMYGYDRGVSPNLDRFAADATQFLNVYSQASWTRASMASIFTGLWPGKHGATGRKDRLSQEAVTLAELLHEAGYQTRAITSNAMVSPTFGFDQGFDIHSTTEDDDPLVLIPMLETWLGRADPSRPFFVWMHALGPHDPYTPPAEQADRLLRSQTIVDGLEQPPHMQQEKMRRYPRSDQQAAVDRWVDLYDGEIFQHDEAFQELLDFLDQRQLLDSTLIIVVSDHGEEFLEHGGIVHGNGLFAEVVRVPLIMRFPDRGRGLRVSQMVDQIDLMPTVLEWAGIDPPLSLEGTSVLGLLEDTSGQPHKRYSFQHQRLEDAFHTAVAEGRWRLVQNRSVSDNEVERYWLFDLEHDPGDLVNAAQFYPVRVRFMERLIEAHLLELPEWETREAELDEETENALRALGYLQ